MWDHASDGAVEDARRGAEVEGTTLRVDEAALAQEGHVLELVAEEGPRHVDLLAAHDSHFLAREQLLGSNRSETPQQMALGIDQNLLFKGHENF